MDRPVPSMPTRSVALLVATLTASSPSRWVRYGIPALLIAVATLTWLSIHEPTAGLPFVLYLSAVFLAALLYGRNAGFFTLGLSIAALAVMFAERVFRIAVDSADEQLALLVFALVGSGITILADLLRATVASLHEALMRLAAADQEKHVLLREVHHRTRNDLQTIVMQLHMAKEQPDAIPQALERAIERVTVMSRVYGRLQRQDGAQTLDAKAYLQDLVDDFLVVHAARSVAVYTRLEPIGLDASTALALGIVANELMTNALKYAFPGPRPGRITVAFRHEGDECVLRVEDNGVGLKDGPPQGTGLGQTIIRDFAEQLDGRFDIRSGEHGACATLSFPATRRHPAE